MVWESLKVEQILWRVRNIPIMYQEVKTKTDQNAFDVKAKDVGAEAKSMETTSGRTCLINRDFSPLWDRCIPAVEGIPPKESGVSYIEVNEVCYSEHYMEDTSQQVDSGIVA